MFVPRWLIIVFGIVFALLVGWTASMVMGRNPLPFPDNGSRIFVASSPKAKEAIVALLARHGVHERFKADSPQVTRSIMWDGTIINHSSSEVSDKVGGASAAIGLVAGDPLAEANAAAAFLRQRGFSAKVVSDVEPGLPISFVLTDALAGSAINFRPHITQMPPPDSVPSADETR